jgi:ribosomal protein S18 acetylase RimI-like enzyme
MQRRMAAIRAFRANDLDALYRIALTTGDGGDDATALYPDPKLVGHIYAGPYAALCPETVFVAVDAEGVGGYIVGAIDTLAFEARAEAVWWPSLRTLYPDPVDVPVADRTPDQRRCHAIHHPRPTPAAIVATHPSHLHINLLPRLRGRGIGRALMDRWLNTVREAGSHGAHLAVGTHNARALRFYAAYGFRELTQAPCLAPGAIWLGISLGA